MFIIIMLVLQLLIEILMVIFFSIGLNSAKEGKVFSLLFSLHIALQLNFKSIYVEGDNRNVIKSVMHDDFIISRQAHNNVNHDKLLKLFIV